ncbi:hypothetical protein LWC35_20030 [Pseudonocardia kujensis]|uniref:DUF6962 family protein n=1 Tax=Pseudonocardia kujensis TaxID=1128675 RepID=UPI001E2D7E66|nr:hypothetical protein [Pseudonocardia kujensis]MCE0765171.1 hypothetical protein [Pseudonocardia kujensis]
MASLTDLALGLVTLYLAPRLPRDIEGARYWRAAFAWAAVTALVGAVYHGFLVGVPQVGEVTWAVMSTMVVLVMSFLLAASVVQVLGRSRAVVFWPLRLLGVLAYVVLAAMGYSSITAIMFCESLTMACVIGLWVWAWLRRHPAGRPMLVAIGVSIAGALLRLVPGAAAPLRLDPDSAYHIGQIVGMVLLFRAAAGSGSRCEAVGDTPAGRSPQAVVASPTSGDGRRLPTRRIKKALSRCLRPLARG